MATFGLVLRQLWESMRKTLPALVGGTARQRATAEGYRANLFGLFYQQIEDALLDWQDYPGAFDHCAGLIEALYRPETSLWLEIGRHGFFGVDRLAEIRRVTA